MKRFIVALCWLLASSVALADTPPIPPSAPPKTLVRTIARAPTATDDATAGYAVGSQIQDTSHNVQWTAVSVTAGAALWVPAQRAGPTLVGNRNMVMQSVSTAGTNQVQSSLTYRTGNSPVCGLQRVDTDWIVSAAGVETANASNLTLYGSVTFGGVTYSWTAGGVSPWTVPASVPYVISDPLGVCIPANTQFSVASFADGGSGNSYVYGIPASTALGDKYENGSALTDKTTAPGTIATTGFFNTYGPTALIGQSSSASGNVLVIHDSRGWGGTTGTNNGDTASAAGGDANGCFGYIQRRLCADGVPYLLIGRPSIKASQTAVAGAMRRRIALAGVLGRPYASVINALGENDVNTSVVYTTIAANLGIVNLQLAPLTYRIVQDTIQPRTITSDNCATLGNQTLAAYEPDRLLLNGVIRAGTIAGQTDYREASDGFETNAAGVLTRDGGYYGVSPSPTSNDCLHLNAVGAATTAGAMTSSKVR